VNAPVSLQLMNWKVTVQEGWPAVPARDILDPIAGHFTAQGFNPITPGEAIAFAALSRCFKHGQSATLALPLANGDTLLHLCFYLHRLRIDAIDDVIRTPWLNHHNMPSKPHLVVLTRPVIRHHQLSRESALHTNILRDTPTSRPAHPDRLATLLISVQVDPATAFDSIERQTHPFAFVIDATPTGLGMEAVQLIHSLELQFPEVPRITLTALGDVDSASAISRCSSAGHIWQMRLGDRMPGKGAPPLFLPSKPLPGNMKLEIGCLTDTTTDALLTNASLKLFALRRTCATEDALTQQNLLGPLNRVMNALRSLCVPLVALEEQLMRDTKPGRFPVRSLARWMELAVGVQAKYGDTLSAHTAAKTALALAYSHLLTATTGKEAAVLDLLSTWAEKRRRIAVLVGTATDVRLLHSLLDRHLDSDLHDAITVQAMDDKKTNAVGGLAFDHVLVLGTVWRSRQHWLAIDTVHMLVLVYPFEKTTYERQLRAWLTAYGGASAGDGDKLRLWDLNWGGKRLLDDLAVPFLLPVMVNSLPYPGTHPRAPNIAVIEAGDRHPDWIEALIADAGEIIPGATQQASAEDPDMVWVALEEYASPMPFNRHCQMLVLQGEEINTRLPADLKLGDEIILLVNSEERSATHNALFTLFVAQSTGLEQLTLVAEKWQSFINSAISKCKTVKALRGCFKTGGVEVTEATIRNWVAHHVIGPENPKAIAVLAGFLDLKKPAELAKRINNAIVRIRTERRAIGRDLNAAILARRRGADSVKIGKLTIDVDELDSMVEICHVNEVTLPPLSTQVVSSALCDIAEQILLQHPGTLHLTPAATRSLSHCKYLDAEKFRQCFLLMATRLYAMYSHQSARMNEILPEFEAHQITFVPQMAVTTQGRFTDYDRTYRGVRVDIGKHFRLGMTYDPTRTMRIHYHYDSTDNLIVIHHAGVHLRTNAD